MLHYSNSSCGGIEVGEQIGVTLTIVEMPADSAGYSRTMVTSFYPHSVSDLLLFLIFLFSLILRQSP